MKRLGAALAVLGALAAIGVAFGAGVAGWQQDQDARGFELYGLHAPTHTTSAPRVQDLAPGACIPKSSGTNTLPFVCTTPNTDYVTPTFSLGGDLGGTPTSANVIGVQISGPTHLTFSGIADGADFHRSGSSIVGVFQTATWPLGAANRRVYLVDGVNGNDANACYLDGGSAVFPISGGTISSTACKTIEAIEAKFPKYGAGRAVEVIIANGGTNTTGTYTGGLASFAQGAYGWDYRSPLVRGTGTNTTAGATAFAGTTADLIYLGGVTADGCNSAGYNPIGTPTTSVIQMQKAGGGNPTLPSEPAAPLGWRIRFDSSTATVALRNAARTVVKISTTSTANDTITITHDTALPATPTTSDTFYLEQAGVSIAGGNWDGPQVNDGLGVPGMTVAGMIFNTTLNFQAGVHFAFSGSTAGVGAFASLVSVRGLYVHPSAGTITCGGGFHAGTSWFQSRVGTLDAHAMVAQTTTTLNQLSYVNWKNGSVSGSTFAVAGTTGTDQSTITSIGSADAESGHEVSRVLGGGMRFLNARLDVGNLDITGVGAVPAIGLRHSDVTQMRDTRITGSTGNTDVGLGFSSFSGASIIDGGASSWNTNNRATSNTITGSLGDIRIENSPTVATGQIITWAQAQSGVLDALANRIIGSTTGWPIRTDAVNGTILSGGTLTVPSLVGPGYAKTSAGGLFSVVSTIPYSDITGGPGGSVTSVGATLPLTSTGGASPTIALNYDNSTITLNGGNGIQVAAQTGDVTKPAGSNVTTLANIPNATPMAGSLLATAIAAPGTPAAGKGSVYVDSTSKNMCVKNDAGTVNHGAQTFTAALHQFATALSDAGAWSTAQPSYSDISGSVPAITSITGDGTASGPGAAALTLATVGTGVGSCTYCSVSFDAKGRETAYSSGTTPVLPTRAINTTSPLTGGGNMSADRTLGFLGPTSNRVYAGNGTGTDIIASDEIRIDDSTDQFMVSNDGMVTWRNLPGSGMISAVNYEQVKAKFVSNVWTLQSQKAGTGTTVRNMSIDATTADLLLAGNNINMSPLSGGGFVGADNSGNVQITTPTAEFNYYIEMSSGRISTLNTGDQYIATSSFDSIFGASPVLEYPTALTVASFARVEACLIGANPITSGEVDVCVEHNGTGGINLTFTSGSSGCQRTASTLIGGATDTVGVMLCQGTGIGGRHTATVTGTVRMTIKLRVSPYSTF